MRESRAGTRPLPWTCLQICNTQDWKCLQICTAKWSITFNFYQISVFNTDTPKLIINITVVKLPFTFCTRGGQGGRGSNLGYVCTMYNPLGGKLHRVESPSPVALASRGCDVIKRCPIADALTSLGLGWLCSGALESWNPGRGQARPGQVEAVLSVALL